MARLEFPSKPIHAPSEPVSESGQIGDSTEYRQPTFDGLEQFIGTEVELGNCTVTSSVTFRKRVKGNVWQCHIHASPDLMHPDQEGAFEVIANGSAADMAQHCHFRPGDRATIRGFLHEQRVMLESGEEIIVTHVSVSAIEVIGRVPRKSVTLYEQQQKK